MRPGTLREPADTLRRAYRAEAVWLFGSAANGAADAGSDLDLLVISLTQEPFFRRMATVRRLLRPFRGEFPVSPIVLTRRSSKTASPPATSSSGRSLPVVCDCDAGLSIP